MDAKILDLNNSVYEITNKYPEVIDIMKDLGFAAIGNSVARNTMGRKMTIPNGCKMHNIPLDKVIETLTTKGFEVVQ